MSGLWKRIFGTPVPKARKRKIKGDSAAMLHEQSNRMLAEGLANPPHRNDFWQRVKAILEDDPLMLTEAVNNAGDSLLHIVARVGDAEGVGVLIGIGAPANITNAAGSFPLHEAVAGGHVACVKLLLEADADPNCRDSRSRSGETPMHSLVKSRKFGEVAKAMLQTESNAVMQHVHSSIAERGNISFSTAEQIVDLLLQYGGDLKARAGAFGTPEELAVEQVPEFVSLFQSRETKPSRGDP